MSGDSWCTPPELYTVLNDEFEFEFDLCANKKNSKCDEWSGDIKYYVGNIYPILILKPTSFFINPPYSRGKINHCMEQVELLNSFGKTVVSLTRFDPSTDWFKEYVDGVAAEVRMLRKRVKFVGANSGYPFPCCVSIYRGFTPRHTHYYSWGLD